MSAGGPKQGALYSPLPQTITDTESSEEEVVSIFLQNGYRKVIVSNEELIEKKKNSQNMADYRPLGHEHDGEIAVNGFSTQEPVVSEDIPVIKIDGSLPYNLQPMTYFRRVLFTLSILLCGTTIFLFLWVLPCENATCPPVQNHFNTKAWEKDFIGLEIKGGINAVQGVFSRNLVFIVRGNVMNPSRGVMAQFMEQAENFSQNEGAIVSLLGNNGNIAWFKRMQQVPEELDCSLIDVDQNDVQDCIVVGSGGLLAAFDPVSGTETFWNLNSKEKMHPMQLEFPMVLLDLNNDGVNELLTSCSFQDTNQNVHLLNERNYLILISGKIGRILGRPLKISNCSKISLMNIEPDWSIMFYCKHPGREESIQSIKFLDLFLQIMGEPISRDISLKILKSIPLKQHYTYGMYKKESKIGNRELTVENVGDCPENCFVTVKMIGHGPNSKQKILYNFTAENMYGMSPVSLALKRKYMANGIFVSDPVYGFVVKFWEWNVPNKHTRKDSIAEENKDYLFKHLSSNQLKREEYNLEVNISQWKSMIHQKAVPGSKESKILSNVSVHYLKEHVFLIAFNSTSIHSVNASQNEVIQFCINQEGTRTHPTCQPDISNQEHSLLIDDLDRDGSQELISYLNTYVHDSTAKSYQLALQSKIRVIQLEEEIPKLFEGSYH